MKLTQILIQKLTRFWLVSLAAVAFIFLLTAYISFTHLSYKFQNQQVDEIESILVENYAQSGFEQISPWLPSLLKAFNTESFQLYQQQQLIFDYQDKLGLEHYVQYRVDLDLPQPSYFVIKMAPPYILHRFTMTEWQVLIFGLIAVIVFVRFGYLWYSSQLQGIESLAKRSQYIVMKEYDRARSFKETIKPKIIDQALTQLLDELEDAQQERSRFDKFIRANTFLDAETGIGNILFLNNRLNALSYEHKMIAHGAVLLMEFEDLELMSKKVGSSQMLELLHLAINGINQLLQAHPDSIFARRNDNQFAIIVPQLSLLEAEQLAAKILKVCLHLPINPLYQQDNILHLGCAYYKEQDSKAGVVEEADMALRAAQLQGNNTWFMYDKGAVDAEFNRGSVRWRALLEDALTKKRFGIITQPVIDSDNLIDHREVFATVKDTQGNVIKANLFIPMAVKCGLMPKIERQIIEQILFEVLPQTESSKQYYAINLSLDSLQNKAFVGWLTRILLEYRHYVDQLIFEVSENVVIAHQQQLLPVFKMIKKMGARICVDHVGQQVVSTQYIKLFQFDLIKLHRSIVSQIHMSPENQLFIRSLIGSLYRTDVQVFAQGVESFEEWQILRILGVSAAQGSYFFKPAA